MSATKIVLGVVVVIMLILAISMSMKTTTPAYKKVGTGYCMQGYMSKATVDGKPGQPYHDVSPYNNSVADCQRLCDANNDCKYMAYGQNSDGKFCAMYDTTSCSKRGGTDHVSYQKL